MRELVVFAYLPGATDAVPAGIFSHDDARRVGSFTYGHRYAERPDVLAVDPVDCPLAGAVIAVSMHEGLYGAFREVCASA